MGDNFIFIMRKVMNSLKDEHNVQDKNITLELITEQLKKLHEKRYFADVHGNTELEQEAANLLRALQVIIHEV